MEKTEKVRKLIIVGQGRIYAMGVAAMVADENGNLYGTTFLGGTRRNGTVWEITP
jgi:hypothetical protein